MNNRDWMPLTKAGKYAMFNNFRAKIEGYQATIGFTNDQKSRMLLICDIYTEIYQKSEQIRASSNDFSAWQDAVLNGTPRGEEAPASPVFPTITMPAGSFIGILSEFREFVNFIKSNPNYTKNIGLDLMIVGDDTNGDNLTEGFPALKVSAKNDTDVNIVFKKGEAEMIEINYRSAGTEEWLFADKGTKSPLTHKPRFTVAGQAEKFEYRGIFMVKNERIGQWSPIYTITLG